MCMHCSAPHSRRPAGPPCRPALPFQAWQRGASLALAAVAYSESGDDLSRYLAVFRLAEWLAVWPAG